MPIQTVGPNVDSQVHNDNNAYLQGLADAAKAVADAAKIDADAAQSAASSAQTTANAALPKAGGTVTGAIVLPGNPASALQAAPKQYIDTNFALKRATPETWIAPTLQNAWVNNGGTSATVGYYKDEFGIVRVRGLIKSGTITAGTLLFTLPAGYRPILDEVRIAASNNGSALVPIAITIASGGVVAIGSFPPGNQWLSLDFTFRAEQ